MTGEAATVARPYEVPRIGGAGRAIALAVLMHVLLAAFLFFGINWQSSEPAVIQAELWSAVPQTAAPAPARVPPPPKVEAPRPVAKAEEPPPKAKVDIAEKAPAKVEPPKKVAKVEPPPPKVVPKAEPPKAQPKPPVEAPVRAPSDLANLLAAAGPPSTGKDAQNSGPRGRDTWIGRLQNAIRSQMRYPENCPSRTVVGMHVELLPNGEVADVSVSKPSGVAAFDQAVERAIRVASPLPRDENGRIPDRSLDLNYRLCEST